MFGYRKDGNDSGKVTPKTASICPGNVARLVLSL